MSESGRRVGTRQKIQQVALELFSEQGYDKTSLREIAERLDVTKAALYYHFRTKEDIVTSLFDDFLALVDEIIAWAREQVVDNEIRREVVRRYSAVITGPDAALMIQFVQGNQSAIRDLKESGQLFSRLRDLTSLLIDRTTPLTAQIKAAMSLGILHIGNFGPIDVDATPEQRNAATLEVALELIAP
ncbi:MAG TPA: helix-turn-helix domain-containing protein [Pseudonocardiaceae bacterium]|jgi:AcrR family transcriptional regulator|nr:helix-turn-helix domain-containing protein [Pseudonocardiaceae bacterium]